MKFDFYITGTIGIEYDWWTGQKGTTADQVKMFLDSNKDKELTIAVSSYGGYISDGIAICEYIAAHGKCNMVIIGMTASAATVLCMKAKSVKIAKGSMMLIHNSSNMLDVWTSANKHGIDELIEGFKKMRDDLDTIDKAIAQIYSTRNGKSLEDIMAKMDEEKWMLAEDALEFGIVDEVIDDNLMQSQSKSVKNAFGSITGISDHFCLPDIPMEENDKPRSASFMERLKTLGRQILNVVQDEEGAAAEDAAPSANKEEEKSPQPTNNNTLMKKLILNLACALLALEHFDLNEKDEATLSKEQLEKIENELKAKNDAIATLTAEKKAAEDAKTKAENDLKAKNDEFEAFKKQAGDDSSGKALDESGKKTAPATAKEMLNDITNLL